VINALEWSRNGHLVATAGGDGLVRLFDIRTFKELEALKGHPKEVTCKPIGQRIEELAFGPADRNDLYLRCL
jgi:WD40 repeat protein